MSKLYFIIDGQISDISESVDFTSIYRGSETSDTNKNNYSLTVKFPFTYTNEKIFLRTNSLSYKSDFPYQTHECNVLSDGVTVISKAKLVLLSTTDSFECALTWDNFDIIGSILNNTTTLGNFLHDFPVLDWNYNHSLMDKAYSSIKAEEYGYILYNDGGGDVGISSTKYYSYQHPVINFKYLLDLVFQKLGFTLNIETFKDDFLKSLIIRPNKEYDNYKNNIFEAYVDATPWIYMPFPEACRITYINESGGGGNSFGNNSYYFKSWIDSTDGEGDEFYTDVAAVPQAYRFKSFADSTSLLTISDFNAGTSDLAVLKKWRALDNTWHTLFTVNGNLTYTLEVEKGDWLVFDCNFDNTHFKVTIETVIDETLTYPNDLRFPSFFHIPTCINLTVGDFIKQSLDLTASELTYDINTDSYNFTDKINQNESAYDITKNITSIKEITYDTKYIYNKLGKENVFKYLSTSPINGDHIINITNDSLPDSMVFISLPFSTSNTQSGGIYNGTAVSIEHTFDTGEIWTRYTEQPLHLLINDTINSTIHWHTDINMESIFNTFYADWFNDLQSLILTGTVRLIKLTANVNDVEFKRINTKGIVYISTYGKYYSIIEIIKQNDNCEFFMLELF